MTQIGQLTNACKLAQSYVCRAVAEHAARPACGAQSHRIDEPRNSQAELQELLKSRVIHVAHCQVEYDCCHACPVRVGMTLRLEDSRMRSLYVTAAVIWLKLLPANRQRPVLLQHQTDVYSSPFHEGIATCNRQGVKQKRLVLARPAFPAMHWGAHTG